MGLERALSPDHMLKFAGCISRTLDDEPPLSLGNLAKCGTVLSAELQFSSINRPSEIILPPRLRHSHA
jgi:hypothetical protein